jgi:glycosyltransferase involved in cell wall biosynthesis
VKKRILVISSRIPFPPTAGFRKRIQKFTEFFGENDIEVDLFFLFTDSDDLEHLPAIRGSYRGIYPNALSVAARMRNLLKSIFLGQSLQVNLYYSKKIARNLRRVIKDNSYDLLLWNHVRTAEYARRIESAAPQIIDYHDSLGYHYLSSSDKAKGLWRLVYKYEGKKIEKYEKRILNTYQMALITSEVDKASIDPDCDRIRVIPMGIADDLISRELPEHCEPWISFIGKMDYYPNVDAVGYFAKEVFPHLGSNLIFKIVGTNPSAKVLALSKNNPRIEVTGFVEDPFEILQRSMLVVAPIRIGGGIQNKILEGMALGKPVVTFPERIAPMTDIRDGKDVVSVSNTAEFIEKTNMLLNNQALREEIGINARRYIASHFTWNQIGKDLMAQISPILHSPTGK